MKDSADKTLDGNRNPKLLRAFGFGCFAVLLILAWLRLLLIETHLVYLQQSPIFMTTLDFFESFIARPGGIVQYAAAFGAQAYYIDWLGAMVLVAAAAGLCVASKCVIDAVTGRKVHFIFSMMPAAGMLILCNMYFHNMAATFALLAALLLACAYCRLAPKSFAGSLAMFGAISVAGYYLVGGTYVVFAVLCAIFELTNRRRYLLGALCLLMAGGIPYLYAWFSYETLLPAAFNLYLPYSGGMPPHMAALQYGPAIIQLCMIACLPLICLLLGVLPGRTKAARPSLTRQWVWGTAALTIAAGLIFFTADTHARTRLRIEWLASAEQWDQLLVEATKLPPELYDTYANEHVNRALSRTGQLAEKMFHYPQGTGYPRLFAPYLDPKGQLNETFANIYFELGHVNRAQHMTHTALEALGAQPRLLKRLAQINILNGKPEAAKTFLNAMAQHLLFRNEAEDYLSALAADPLNAGDEQLKRLRKVMLRKDFYYFDIASASYDDKLLQLLDSNPNDRVAFEYLMAGYLMKTQIEKVAANLPRIDSFGYKTTPTPYQEAAWLDAVESGRPDPQLTRYIDRETAARLERFRRDLAPFVKAGAIDTESAGKALADKYGRSYFFYDALGFSVAPTGGDLPQSVTGASK